VLTSAYSMSDMRPKYCIGSFRSLKFDAGSVILLSCLVFSAVVLSQAAFGARSATVHQYSAEAIVPVGSELDLPPIDATGRQLQGIRTILFMPSCTSCSATSLVDGKLSKSLEPKNTLLVFGDPERAVAASLSGLASRPMYVAQRTSGSSLAKIWNALSQFEAVKLGIDGRVTAIWDHQGDVSQFLGERSK
jgi:hypothetical protein